MNTFLVTIIFNYLDMFKHINILAMNNNPHVIVIISLLILVACTPEKKVEDNSLAQVVANDKNLDFVKQKALEIIGTGFNAGDGYHEVWIRDYNTFIEAAARVYPAKELKENLLVFFGMQGADGNIIDGFTPIELVGENTKDFSYSELEPDYAGHKSHTVSCPPEALLQQKTRTEKCGFFALRG